MVPIRQRARWRRVLALAASAVAAAGLLTACGGGDGTPELTWYINPDPNPPDGFEGPFGQAGIADRCSTDQYTIKTELLPQSATEQRIQLLRRLVAEDSSISLMSLDPVFTAEFAEAGFLEPLPDDARRRRWSRTTCRARSTARRGTASWWRRPCGRTPRRCGTASRWRRRPAWT